MNAGPFRQVAEIPIDTRRGRVHEHGWQSWSPTTSYPATATSHRPSRPVLQTMCWRPQRPGPARGFQGEGLLAIDPGDGAPIHLFSLEASPAAFDATPGATDQVVPSIRAEPADDRLVVSADGPVDEVTSAASLDGALAAWADGYARAAEVPPVRAAPTVWCSWYQYFTEVTDADISENIEAITRLELPIDVIQIDDGWQAEIGDWLELSDRFTSLADVVARIRDSGRRTGVWIAPFLVGARSRLARDHPDWLVADTDAGHNWGQRLGLLDVTHPQAAAYLRHVFAELRQASVDYFKLDFLYAGALVGLAAYRDGLRLIRDTVGPEGYLVGSGAPVLPSIGLIDALRVSPDIGTRVDPIDGDMSRPSLQAAALSVAGRAWQHGRFWVNDPDCLLARPAMPQRERWAAIIERYGGLRASGDRIRDLDHWGLATTRQLLSAVPPPTPFPHEMDERRRQ
jgi:alpha-galactosidase